MILRNLRFSAYRSAFFWLHGRKSPSGLYRKALPSCLVSYIRRLYPDEVYTGFQPKKRTKHNGTTLNPPKQLKSD